MITLRNLSKSYDKKVALNNINITIEDKVILGLIGANGSGKTTLMKLIAKDLQPSSGSVEHLHYKENYNNTCMMSDYEKILENYSLKKLYKVMPEFYKEFDIELAQKMSRDLELKEKTRYSKLSKGEKGKLNLIIAISSHASITLLDETYISLDAPSRHKIYNYILESYQEHPRTFIISTHYIDEVSRLFEDVLILDKGQVLLHESKDDIESKSLTLFGPTLKGEEILAGFNIIAREVIGKRTIFSIYDDISSLEAQLAEHNFEISLRPLEETYVQLIERSCHE